VRRRQASPVRGFDFVPSSVVDTALGLFDLFWHPWWPNPAEVGGSNQPRLRRSGDLTAHANGPSG